VKRRIVVFLFCLWPIALFAADAAPATDDAVLKQLHLLNQVPEDQVSEKVDPAFSILRTIYDTDGPDFYVLKKLLAKADIRATLNPSARCVLAGVISQRWDTFTLSGNLYLSGLQSRNAELREKARRKFVGFLQPVHIPILINLLKIPGPNVMAYEILQEATGKKIDPSIKSWRKWWSSGGSKADIIGHLLQDTQMQLEHHRMRGFDQERYWYMPMGMMDAQIAYSSRPEKDQMEISAWNNWAKVDVKQYVDEWAAFKPVIDRLIHQPDPRVNTFLESLVADPGFGDYASVVLAWRSNQSSLEAIQKASVTQPTVGRALARGSLGDETALDELLQMMERHSTQPLSFKIMDDDVRAMLPTLRTVGVVPAEQAFNLLCHQNFDFDGALTSKEKKKAFQKAATWLKHNAARLSLDHRRGYFLVPPEQ